MHLSYGDSHFNPRSPHGERRQMNATAQAVPPFQSTLPARGATCNTPYVAISKKFQSTLPARGATSGYMHLSYGDSHFNPRSPHGERRQMNATAQAVPPFQSTLPARGATCNTPYVAISKKFQSTLPARGATRHCYIIKVSSQFQSTLPARGATVGTGISSPDRLISIHAPRTGSDANQCRYKQLC